jgi:hypothetical protein
MANVISQMVQDILFRLDDPKGNVFPPTTVLRAMRRLYQRLNHEFMPLVRPITVNDTNYPTFSTNGYIALPADWIRPFKMYHSGDMLDVLEYRSWEVYDSTEDDTFSINSNRLYISDAAADTEVEVSYYSAGYTLVDAEDAAVLTGEVNEPEYPDHLQQILLYGTCIDLSNQYPRFESDLRMFLKLQSALGDLRTFQQAVTPETAGPKGRRSYLEVSDPYA